MLFSLPFVELLEIAKHRIENIICISDTSLAMNTLNIRIIKINVRMEVNALRFNYGELTSDGKEFSWNGACVKKKCNRF